MVSSQLYVIMHVFITMHVWCYGVLSWHIVVLSPNGEESLELNKLLSPDPDHLRGGPSHGHNTSCVKKIKSIGAIVFELRVRTDARKFVVQKHDSRPMYSIVVSFEVETTCHIYFCIHLLKGLWSNSKPHAICKNIIFKYTLLVTNIR